MKKPKIQFTWDEFRFLMYAHTRLSREFASKTQTLTSENSTTVLALLITQEFILKYVSKIILNESNSLKIGVDNGTAFALREFLVLFSTDRELTPEQTVIYSHWITQLDAIIIALTSQQLRIVHL